MLTASLVHGWGAYIFISDEGMPCGANWTLELVPWQDQGVFLHQLCCTQFLGCQLLSGNEKY